MESKVGRKKRIATGILEGKNRQEERKEEGPKIASSRVCVRVTRKKRRKTNKFVKTKCHGKGEAKRSTIDRSTKEEKISIWEKSRRANITKAASRQRKIETASANEWTLSQKRGDEGPIDHT